MIPFMATPQQQPQQPQSQASTIDHILFEPTHASLLDSLPDESTDQFDDDSDNNLLTSPTYPPPTLPIIDIYGIPNPTPSTTHPDASISLSVITNTPSSPLCQSLLSFFSNHLSPPPHHNIQYPITTHITTDSLHLIKVSLDVPNKHQTIP
eukprot:TRINITY_DN4880_c0_g4_i1.p1 TRINITY_DN4880_c0_g4~~TRINITY_DN4880_c0_g4_i1.p1  ORF type:complete len:162 (-),score=47.57 TRINITY_DN4880_c0_g4_i1:846-1298(-)